MLVPHVNPVPNRTTPSECPNLFSAFKSNSTDRRQVVLMSSVFELGPPPLSLNSCPVEKTDTPIL